jgi:hypothetical protein
MSTSVSSPSSSFQPSRQQLDELDALLQRMLELPVNQLEETALEKAAEAARAGPEPEAADTPAPEPDALAQADTESQPEAGILPQESEPAQAADSPPAHAESTPSGEEDVSAAEVRSEQAAGIDPMQVDPAEGQAEEWVPLRSSWKPSEQTWPPLVEHWQQTRAAAPEPPSLELPLTPPLQSVLAGPLPPTMPTTPAPVPAAQAPEAAAPEAASWLKEPLPPPETDPLAEHPPEPPRILLPLVWFNQGFDSCLQPLGPLGRWLAGGAGKTLLGLIGLGSLAAAVVLAVGDRIGWTW